MTIPPGSNMRSKITRFDSFVAKLEKAVVTCEPTHQIHDVAWQGALEALASSEMASKPSIIWLLRWHGLLCLEVAAAIRTEDTPEGDHF